MKEILEFSKELKDMPVAALVTVVILGAFALSAFAIHAVSKNNRGHHGRS